MKKICMLLGVLTASILQAQNSVSVYGGSLDYSDSAKDTGWFSGIYYQNSSLTDKLELAYERTEISYIDTATQELKQNDITAAWTHYLSSNYLFRVGGHYINSNDALTDNGFVVFTGLKYFQGFDFDMGVDGYYSEYTNYTYTSSTQEGLTVVQVEPSIGFNFSDYLSPMGSFYLKVFYDYIAPDTKNTGTLNDTYHSAGFSLKNFNGSWSNEIGGWAGKQVFAVKNGGFSVYNLAEERKFGTYASVHYAFTKSTGLKIQYAYESFDEEGFSNASSQTLFAVLNHSF